MSKPCSVPCVPRRMMGRSWWKCLGYDSPCLCAKQAREKADELHVKWLHVFTMDELKGYEMCGNKLRRVREPVEKCGIEILGATVRVTMGDSQMVGDRKFIKTGTYDELKKYCEDNGLTVVVPKWGKDVCDLASMLMKI